MSPQFSGMCRSIIILRYDFNLRGTIAPRNMNFTLFFYPMKDRVPVSETWSLTKNAGNDDVIRREAHNYIVTHLIVTCQVYLDKHSLSCKVVSERSSLS